MNSQSLTQVTNEASNQTFCIHKKLKEFNNGLSYAFPSHPIHHEGVTYLLNTSYYNQLEYALYKRKDNNFFLVDFFTDFDLACEEAKEIIRGVEKYSRVFGSDDDANQTPEPNPTKPE
ncbi:MAG: hypothetical protein ACTINL_08150 [Serratia proteamaculans]